ncbi:MAG: hypothetical protein EHM72_18250, partial [Calditrichaeota bacterium]
MREYVYRIVTMIMACLAACSLPLTAGEDYQNFNLAVYCPQWDMRRMQDEAWLESTYNMLTQYIHIEKVYLETHRNLDIIEKDHVLKIKKFFEDRGVKVSGGITYVVSEQNRFQSFCYTNADDRKKIREIAEYTASLFDEVLLDDFFFTNCKCRECIKAKGDKSWTDFRCELMTDVAKNLVVGPAKRVNPHVKMVIKYPNWYDHFQYTGYNLETEPKIFDMIYTGTETRDPVYTHQHLQPYQSYGQVRYFENIAPGRNGGGWVDPGTHQFLDRYVEQIALTLFAKAKEQMLFCWGALVQSIRKSDGNDKPHSEFAPVLGYHLERIDEFLASLGSPIGIKSYKPYHSKGEDFLQNYIGMLGIPMDMTPEFPVDQKIIFLTEQAASDDHIVEKIKQQLIDGKEVMITSGLYHALQGRGIEDIVELELTGRKALVHQFYNWNEIFQSEKDILIPQLRYATNDSWELITALDSGVGYPILQQAAYGDSRLYVLTIPDNFGELYELPAEILSEIKRVLMKNFIVYIDSPADVSLFIYDNHSFILHSFKPYRLPVKVVLDHQISTVIDLETKQKIDLKEENGKWVFTTRVEPHNYEVYQAALDSARAPALDSARAPALDSARAPALDSARAPALDSARAPA